MCTSLFPPHECNLAQSRLASLLNGVLCQALAPKADGSGRVAAAEVMLANPAVRNFIREGKLSLAVTLSLPSRLISRQTLIFFLLLRIREAYQPGSR